MIPFNKFLLLIIVLNVFSLRGQQDSNLFSLPNSVQYAEYLYQNEKFDLAKEEYSRLYYLDKQNVLFQTRLLNAYHFSGDIKGGLGEARQMYANDSLFPDTVANAFLHLLFSSEYRYRTQVFLESNHVFSKGEQTFYLASNALLNDDFATSKILMGNVTDTLMELRNLQTILFQDSVFQPRSKVLAISMSTVVPGLGKVYLGQWKDGLASFLYTSLSAWQAYRGFKNKGVKSFYGWTFACVGTGFYLGNIYGTGKGHRLRIEKHKTEIKNQVKHVVEASFN